MVAGGSNWSGTVVISNYIYMILLIYKIQSSFECGETLQRTRIGNLLP